MGLNAALATMAIACAACSGPKYHAYPGGIEVIVQTALGDNGNGGNVVVLHSTDGKCMYFGEVTAPRGRRAGGVGESLISGTVNNAGEGQDWTATVHSAACLDMNGKYATRQVDLIFEGSQPLHAGDKAVLRERN